MRNSYAPTLLADGSGQRVIVTRAGAARSPCSGDRTSVPNATREADGAARVCPRAAETDQAEYSRSFVIQHTVSHESPARAIRNSHMLHTPPYSATNLPDLAAQSVGTVMTNETAATRVCGDMLRQKCTGPSHPALQSTRLLMAGSHTTRFTHTHQSGRILHAGGPQRAAGSHDRWHRLGGVRCTRRMP